MNNERTIKWKLLKRGKVFSSKIVHIERGTVDFLKLLADTDDKGHVKYSLEQLKELPKETKCKVQFFHRSGTKTYQLCGLISVEITICHIVDLSDIVIARGISICSPKDSFCRRNGRSIALERAAYAYYEEDSALPVKPNYPHLQELIGLNVLWKSEYLPDITISGQIYQKSNFLQDRDYNNV